MDFILELLIVLLTIYILLQNYASKQIKPSIFWLTYLSWFLSFGIVVLLPCDIYYTQQNEYLKLKQHSSKQELEQSQKVVDQIYFYWIFCYWTTFILSWILLPLIQEYEDSGELTTKDKIQRSLYNNILFYGVCLIFLVLIYLAVCLKHYQYINVFHFASSISNSFGNILIAVLMSQGLITIPRNLYTGRNIRSRLQEIHSRLSVLKNNQQEQKQLVYTYIQTLYLVIKKPNQNIEIVKTTSKIIESIDKEYVQESIKQIKNENVQCQISKINSQKWNNGMIYELNRKVKRNIFGLQRITTEIQLLIEEGIKLDLAIEYQSNKNLVISPVYIYQLKLKNALRLIFSFIFTFLGVVIVSTQIIISIEQYFYNRDDTNNIIIQSLVKRKYFTMIQIISFIFLSYLVVAVNQGLFKLKLADLYGLYGNHQTDVPSLLFASINFSRVTVPLSFNFLRLTQLKNSQFQLMMGQLDQGFFTNDSSLLFSIILFILCIFNIFDIYSKFLSMFGLEYFQFNSSAQSIDSDIGKKIIQQEKLKNRKEDKLMKLINSLFRKNQFRYQVISQDQDIL